MKGSSLSMWGNYLRLLAELSKYPVTRLIYGKSQAAVHLIRMTLEIKNLLNFSTGTLAWSPHAVEWAVSGVGEDQLGYTIQKWFEQHDTAHYCIALYFNESRNCTESLSRTITDIAQTKISSISNAPTVRWAKSQVNGASFIGSRLFGKVCQWVRTLSEVIHCKQLAVGNFGFLKSLVLWPWPVTMLRDSLDSRHEKCVPFDCRKTQAYSIVLNYNRKVLETEKCQVS